jgi:hypothetical protein
MVSDRGKVFLIDMKKPAGDGGLLCCVSTPSAVTPAKAGVQL